MSLYCDDLLPDFFEDLCALDLGRVISVSFLRNDFSIPDPTNATDWNNAINSGTVNIIRRVRGDKPKSSPVSIDGFHRQKTRTISYDRTLNYQHPDIIGNEDFYDALNFNNSYSIAYYTQNKKIWMPPSDLPIVNVDADHVVETGIDSEIIADVVVTWASKNMHVAFDAPVGIFE